MVTPPPPLEDIGGPPSIHNFTPLNVSFADNCRRRIDPFATRYSHVIFRSCLYQLYHKSPLLPLGALITLSLVFLSVWRIYFLLSGEQHFFWFSSYYKTLLGDSRLLCTLNGARVVIYWWVSLISHLHQLNFSSVAGCDFTLYFVLISLYLSVPRYVHAKAATCTD